MSALNREGLGMHVSVQSCFARPNTVQRDGQVVLGAVIGNENDIPVEVQVNWMIGGSRWGQAVEDIPANGSREVRSSHQANNIATDVGEGRFNVEAVINPPVVEGDRVFGP